LRKAILIMAVLLLVVVPAYAQYNIHLKNGSVIRGVASYEEIDGELRFAYLGGTLGIPLDDVLKVERAKTGDVMIAPEPGVPTIREAPRPVVPPTQVAPPVQPENETVPIKQRLSVIDGRLAQIEAKESEYNGVKKEYDHVRLRIEVLFQQGIAEAKRKGGDPAKWFQFLPAQERKWVQLNTLKKNKLKKDLSRLDMALAPLLEEKEALLEEKQQLEEELREIESPLY
jgi:hypothetical protein